MRLAVFSMVPASRVIDVPARICAGGDAATTRSCVTVPTTVRCRSNSSASAGRMMSGLYAGSPMTVVGQLESHTWYSADVEDSVSVAIATSRRRFSSASAEMAMAPAASRVEPSLSTKGVRVPPAPAEIDEVAARVDERAVGVRERTACDDPHVVDAADDRGGAGVGHVVGRGVDGSADDRRGVGERAAACAHHAAVDAAGVAERARRGDEKRAAGGEFAVRRVGEIRGDGEREVRARGGATCAGERDCVDRETAVGGDVAAFVHRRAGAQRRRLRQRRSGRLRCCPVRSTPRRRDRRWRRGVRHGCRSGSRRWRPSCGLRSARPGS